ncbi:DUF6538 domain-containing protein [Vibrio splendidus]|uniref:DUF6538 domain-containing protein n=1 Tax=Vibrio splendidus TaxID=29497 RepID=UPI000D39B6C5|nr:DUF6538 domain-containing protein [Vibrio splendidus]PTO78565.1 hypothetical protein CWN84_06895 [Vibrio splendidus]
MRNLHISKNGIWQFRYQIPSAHRHLFDNRYEIKRSLRTSDKQTAIVNALKLGLEIRVSIQQNQPLTVSKLVSGSPARPASPANLMLQTKPTSPDPFKCLEKYRHSKQNLVNPKTIEMAYAKCHIVLTLLKAKGIKDIRRLQAEEARIQ